MHNETLTRSGLRYGHAGVWHEGMMGGMRHDTTRNLFWESCEITKLIYKCVNTSNDKNICLETMMANEYIKVAHRDRNA